MKSLAKKVLNKLLQQKIKISIAESCTGGLLSSKITSLKGSSKVFSLGVVVYSNQSKVKILKISKKIIKKYGAVSKQVCLAMLRNVSKISKTKMSISITGVAGPTGGTKKKPVGLVYIGFKNGKKIKINKYLFEKNKRNYIQREAANKSLKLILGALK
tara:strand:- start:378 stop:851 length:474 start_codon:yes stop_codon:yes gene_type:complete